MTDASNSTSDDASPFLLTRYDSSSYFGRLADFFVRLNPKFLFSREKDIKEAIRVVKLAEDENWKSIRSEGITQDQFFQYKLLYDSCVHAQTSEILPPIGRVSMFVPINIPISAGMLLAAPTLTNCIGWQWFNQSYNAIFNKSNANRSLGDEKKLSFWEENKDPLKGYLSASAVSITLAVGLTEWLKRGRFSPRLKTALQAIVPYCAVASAGASNVALMRMNELGTGVDVFTPDGTCLGKSKVAAKKGLALTAFSRLVLPFPILALPPPILAVMRKFPIFTSNTFVKTVMELTVLTGGVVVGFPCAIALFTQQQNLPISELETELVEKMTPQQRANFQYVTYNKGI